MPVVRPSELPKWATDTTYSSGPFIGQPTKINPAAGVKTQGFYPEAPFAAEHQNWWEGLVGDWAEYLDDQRLLVKEQLVRGALASSRYEVSAAMVGPVPLPGLPQFVYLGASSLSRRHTLNGSFAGGITPPNFATGSSSIWSFAVDPVNYRALGVIDSTSSVATRLARFNANAWAAQDLPVSYNGASRVAFIGTKFFVAQANGSVYSSTTGATGSWSAATALPVNTGYRHFEKSAEGGGVWIGCSAVDSGGANGYVLRTADGGATWSAVLMPGTSPGVWDVAYDAIRSRFVAVGALGSNGGIWTSTDGTSWTQLSFTISNNDNPAVSSPTIGSIVITQETMVLWGSGSSRLYTSRDGGSTLNQLSQLIQGTYAPILKTNGMAIMACGGDTTLIGVM